MGEFVIRIVHGAALSPDHRARILALCADAYHEDFTSLFQTFRDPVHFLGYEGDRLVSHAAWITRWLQVNPNPPMRTAYLEAVATAPAARHRGYASQVLRRLVDSLPKEIVLAALCPSDEGQALYPRLGWEPWHGPLSIRGPDRPIPTPEERVMIYRLPQTPPLDTRRPLSAEWREGELW